MFDVNNNYRGTFFGADRIGHTTPDPDASEPLRPFLPVQYPAPWLAGKRRDEGHPVGAQVVISAGQLVGLDKSGALVPAGMISGTQAASGFGDTSGYWVSMWSVSWLLAVIPSAFPGRIPSGVMEGRTNYSGGPAPDFHRLPGTTRIHAS